MPDTHDADVYRSAFFKRLLGKDLTEAENKAFTAATAEKRADSLNTLSNSSAVIPAQTLNEVIKQVRDVNGLYNEICLFNVPSKLSVPVSFPTDAASCMWKVRPATPWNGFASGTGTRGRSYSYILENIPQ